MGGAGAATGEPWKPYKTLRDSDVEFALVDLPDGAGNAILATDGQAAAIMVRRDLPQPDRRCALGHELVHHERGGTSGLLDVDKEERQVERITARRLLPDRYLEQIIAELLDEHDGITAALVSERTDVTVEYCELRLTELLDATRARHPSTRRR